MAFSLIALCAVSLLAVTNATTSRWKLLLSQRFGTPFPSDIISDPNYVQPDSSNQDAYTIINELDASNQAAFRNNNDEFQFRLLFDHGDDLEFEGSGKSFDQTWTQKNWPSDDEIMGSSLQQQGNPCVTAAFYGVAMSGYAGTAYDGNARSECFWQGFGFTPDAPNGYGGFPVLYKPGGSPDAWIAQYVQLFVCDRAGGDDCDESQWKLLLSQRYGDGNWFDAAITDPANQYVEADASNQNKYTIVDDPMLNRAAFKDAANKYQFRLIFADGVTFDQTWTQQSWPSDPVITGSSLGTPTQSCWSDQLYGVSAAGTSAVAYDGDGSPACFWKGFGFTNIPTGYAGFPVLYKPGGNPNAWMAQYVQLFVCDGSNINDCDDNTPKDCGVDGNGDAVECASVAPVFVPASEWFENYFEWTQNNTEVTVDHRLLFVVIGAVIVLLTLNVVMMTLSMCRRREKGGYKAVSYSTESE